MKTSKEIFTKWLKKETKKFRKTMPRGATHYKIGKNKVKWYRLGNDTDGFYCGYFMRYNKKKKCFFEPIPLVWDESVITIYW